MSQDSLSDPSKRPQIQDIYKIYQIYLLNKGPCINSRARALQPQVFRDLSLWHSLCFTLFLEPPWKKQPLSILGNINLIPMVWKDLTYGLRHFWQCPQTICHFPQTMWQTIVIFPRTIQVTSIMQDCGFYLAATWLFFQLQFSNKSLRCKSVIFISLQSRFLC